MVAGQRTLAEIFYRGLADNDVINALGGYDFLDGGSGFDALNGGSGDDTYALGSEYDRVVDVSGTDTITTANKPKPCGLRRYREPDAARFRQHQRHRQRPQQCFTGNGGANVLRWRWQ